MKNRQTEVHFKGRSDKRLLRTWNMPQLVERKELVIVYNTYKAISVAKNISFKPTSYQENNLKISTGYMLII